MMESSVEIRQALYLRYNTVDFDKANELVRIENDEIWTRACWIKLFSREILEMKKIKELLD